MLKLLIKKELSEKLLDFRFILASLLFVVLMPLGMYVSCKDYERRLVDYRSALQSYQDQRADKIDQFIEIQGFRPPSPMSVFALGLDASIPDRVVTSHSGQFRSITEPVTGSPSAYLFSRTDYLFNVTFVVSLAALMFTFDAVSREKEMGTLKLMISHAVPRGSVLLSKLIGNFLALSVPFLLALLIALLFLERSSVIALGVSLSWPSVLTLVLVTLVYMLAMIALGLWVSTRRHYSIDSLILVFFTWTLLSLGVPKISPMLARVLYPIESPDAIRSSIRVLSEDLERQLKERQLALKASVFDALGVSDRDRQAVPPQSENGKNALAQYRKDVVPLLTEHRQRLNEDILRIEREYERKRKKLYDIAVNISRFSPVSCYVYVASGLAGTGAQAAENLLQNARRFQEEAESALYDHIMVTHYGSDMPGTKFVQGFDAKKATIPSMVYRYPTLREILNRSRVDLLILGLYGILFYGLSFRGLQRYDVR